MPNDNHVDPDEMFPLPDPPAWFIRIGKAVTSDSVITIAVVLGGFLVGYGKMGANQEAAKEDLIALETRTLTSMGQMRQAQLDANKALEARIALGEEHTRENMLSISGQLGRLADRIDTSQAALVTFLNQQEQRRVTR